RLSGQLSLERQSAAILFATAIESELQSLALGGTKVLIDIRQLRDDTNGVPISVRDADPAARFAVTATGIDRVEFMIAVNPGEPFRPLARVASGGETSRLMLAIKSVLSAVDEIPTLVFDEIDAGIGGRLGGTIGQKLWGLGRQHQVVSVTHLPQIASHADHHVRVSKGAVADRASTSAEVLDATEAVREISLMLGSDTDTGRHNAAEMLNGARRWQSSAARP
ncbi:MAG: DNA repair protein RecN, partial [Chloroflexi bacterium]|nr:DNA repair protein RecN [Chloroflexota bacterium]